jgi:hypothetical protein
VIVPDFGGFLGQYRPARLQRERKRILPPGKEITFNRELVRNDGLLADRLAVSEGVAYQESTRIIQRYVAEWSKELQSTGRLELKNIGVFIREATGQLVFEPDRSTNYAANAFGLRATAAIPVKREVRVDSKPTTTVVQLEPEPSPTEDGRNGSLVYWGAAATAALLLTIGALAVLSVGGPSNGELANLFPIDTTLSRSYEKRVEPFQDTWVVGDTDDSLSIADLSEGLNQVRLVSESPYSHLVWREPEPSVAEPVSTKVVTAERRGRYHVVVGCFSIEENAHKLVDGFNKRGVNARILDKHKGLFRVVYDSYAVKAEAIAGLEDVRTSGNDGAWLLVK